MTKWYVLNAQRWTSVQGVTTGSDFGSDKRNSMDAVGW